MDEDMVDEVINELDKEETGFINTSDYGKTCFQIKDANKENDQPTNGNAMFKSGAAKPNKKPVKKGKADRK